MKPSVCILTLNNTPSGRFPFAWLAWLAWSGSGEANGGGLGGLPGGEFCFRYTKLSGVKIMNNAWQKNHKIMNNAWQNNS